MENDKILDNISQKSIDKTINEFGNINILVCGKTGIGKSTLINAIFGGEYAKTGQGKPVTQTIEEIHKNGSPLTLYDSKGLECEKYKPILDDIEKFLELKRNTDDITKQIHIAWICIMEDLRRVEPVEIELGKILTKKKVPFIVVITKAMSDNGFRQCVSKEFEIPENKVIRVRAKELKLDEGGFIIPTIGLKELVSLTSTLIPEATKNAFAAAQKVDLKYKILKCQAIIGTSAVGAAALGAAPIPFSDCICLIPLQVVMLTTISYLFGLNFDKGFFGSLVSSVSGCSLATCGGTKVVAKLFQFFKTIPGVGIISGFICGGTAFTLTSTIGEIYMGVIILLIEDGKKPTMKEIMSEFKKRLKDKKSYKLKK